MDSSDFEWEYLDDYYDADPSVPQPPLRKRRSSDPGAGAADAKKRKRRMVEDDSNRPSQTTTPSDDKHYRKCVSVDQTTFPGVIWRTRAHSASPTPLFEPGNGRPVAILKNWRESIVSKPRPDAAGQPPSMVTQSRRHDRPRKRTKIDAEDGDYYVTRDSEGYQSDAEDDLNGNGRSAGSLPPVSLVPTDDLPEEKKNNNNTTTKPASKRGQKAPSRLKETVSAEDGEKEGNNPSYASLTSVPEPKSTTDKRTVDAPQKRNDGAHAHSGETATRGRKRKASSSHPEDAHQEQGRASPLKDDVETQSQEQAGDPPPRRSVRRRNKT